MYHLIRDYIDLILGSIDPKRDVDPYIFLVKTFPNVDVSKNEHFQNVFRRYWQLNQSRMSRAFLQSFFELLEGPKCDKNISPEWITRKLYAIPTQRQRQTVQFSFSTKLYHTLHPNAPVYDSSVEAFFFLPRSPAQKQKDVQQHLDRNLKRLLPAYEFLHREYARILQKGLLDQPIAEFRSRYDLGTAIAREKIIDTLIWKFVGFVKGGAIRNGRVIFS